MAASEEIRGAVLARFDGKIEDAGDISGMPTFVVPADSIIDVCEFLASEPSLKFDYLMSLCGVDWEERLEVVYHLYSVSHKHYTTLKVKVGKDKPIVPTTIGVWKAADWQEREVFDMFGIEFDGHPDLRRILLEEDWVGFPLRKDYVEQ